MYVVYQRGHNGGVHCVRAFALVSRTAGKNSRSDNIITVY